MELPSLLIASLGGTLVLHFFLIPRAAEAWRATDTPAVISKAVTVGLLTELRTIGLMASIAFGLTYLLVAVVSLWGALPRSDYGFALLTIGGLRQSLSLASKTLATVSFVLLAGGLAYVARRRTRRTMREAYEQAVGREIERLREAIETDNWESLEPSAQMLEVERQFLAIHAFRDGLVPDAPDFAAKQAAAQQAMDELQKQWARLDWVRRLHPKWEVPNAPDPARSWRGRVRNLLMSEGMFRTTGDLSKTLSRAALVLLFLSLVGLQADPLRAAADHQSVRLSQLAVARDKQAAIDAARAAEPTPVPVDSQIVNEVSRRFEQAFGNSVDLRTPPSTAAEARSNQAALRRMAVRERIIDEAVTPQPPGTDGRVGPDRAEHLTRYASLDEIESLEPREREALSLLRHATSGEMQPQSYVGRDMAQAIHESGVTGTGVWGRLQEEVRGRRAQFGALVSLEEVGGDLVNEALGAVMENVTPSSTSEIGKLVERLGGKASSGVIRSMYEIKRDAFLRDIARGVDVQAALQRVLIAHPEYIAVTLENRAALQETFQDMPRSVELAPKLAERQPRLRWAGAAPDQQELDDALKFVREQRPRLATVGSVADEFAEFEDFFPGQVGAVRGTPRSRVVDEFVGSLPRNEVGPELASIVRQRLGVSDALVSLATDARALAGFFRIGGVVIGQDPSGKLDTAFSDIAWRRQRDTMALWLISREGTPRMIGAFPAPTVRQGLAYAADDRRVAATMTMAPSSRSRGLKVHLHPALMDTPLGLDLIEIDRFVDTYVHQPWNPQPTPAMREVTRATRRVNLAQVLYNVATFYRLSVASLDAKERRGVDSLLHDIEVRSLPELDSAVRDRAAVSDPRVSPLTVKTAFYDSSLVASMVACLDARPHHIAQFGECVRVRSRARAMSADLDEWRSLPEAIDWSGVREEQFTPDADLAFVRASTPTAPLRFVLQVAFTSPPMLRDSRNQGAGVGDPAPWEYPGVAALVDGEVARLAPGDPARAVVLQHVQEFVLLQRLFRTALAGALGDDFPVERLVLLARATRSDVRRVRTPRWNYERVRSRAAAAP